MPAVRIHHTPFCRLVPINNLSIVLISVTVIRVVRYIAIICIITREQRAVLLHHVDGHRDRLSVHDSPVTQERHDNLRSYVIQYSELALLIAEPWILIERIVVTVAWDSTKIIAVIAEIVIIVCIMDIQTCRINIAVLEIDPSIIRLISHHTADT